MSGSSKETSIACGGVCIYEWWVVPGGSFWYQQYNTCSIECECSYLDSSDIIAVYGEGAYPGQTIDVGCSVIR